MDGWMDGWMMIGVLDHYYGYSGYGEQFVSLRSYLLWVDD
jgi:hypothetical protein